MFVLTEQKGIITYKYKFWKKKTIILTCVFSFKLRKHLLCMVMKNYNKYILFTHLNFYFLQFTEILMNFDAPKFYKHVFLKYVQTCSILLVIFIQKIQRKYVEYIKNTSFCKCFDRYITKKHNETNIYYSFFIIFLLLLDTIWYELENISVC